MFKLLLAAVVVVGVIAGAAHFMSQHNTGHGPVTGGGPVVIQQQMPNPLGGGQPSSGDKVYVP